VSANTQTAAKSGRLLRGMGVLTLVLAAFGLGALSQRGLSAEKPVSPQRTASKKPLPPPKPSAPKVVEASPKAPETIAANSVSIGGSIADEYGRALADVMVFAGHDIPEADAAAKAADVGELGVIAGPVPAIPVDKPAAPPANGASARTDQDGKFLIRGLPAGLVEVFISHAGYESSFIVLEGLKPGDSRDDLYLVLRTPLEARLVDQVTAEQALADNPDFARISGMVLDALGRGVPNALVQTDEGEASTRTDASGAFRLVGVAEGVLRLSAEDPTAGSAQSQEVRARKGETLPNVLLHLPARHVPSATDRAATTPGLAIAAQPGAPAQPRAAQASTSALPALAGGLALEARPNGVFVNLVDKDSAPARAGIEVGDVMLSIDDEAVLSVSQARGMLRDPAGEIAKIRVQRGKKRLSLRWKRPALRYAPGSRR